MGPKITGFLQRGCDARGVDTAGSSFRTVGQAIDCIYV